MLRAVSVALFQGKTENIAACCELRTSGKAQPRLKPTWVERIKVVAHRCPDLRYIMKYVAWTYLSEETPDTHNHASLELISVSLG